MRRRGAVLAVAVVAATLFLAQSATATHFRFGSLSWEPRPATQTTAEFTLTGGFRRCGFAGTAADGCPAIGDRFLEFIGFTVLLPGDGTAIGDPLQFATTSVNPIQDWLLARAEGTGAGDPAGVLVHQYPAPNDGGNPWVAAIDTCCRISTSDHINNRDGTYRVETLVDLASGNRSPRSALPPIVSCELGEVCRFVALATDPDGDPLRWRLSTPCEAASGCGFTQPGPPHAPGALTVDPDDGLVSWDTTGAQIDPTRGYGLYSTQITIEDLDAAGAAKSKTAVDFFIRVAPVPPFAPRFETPPTPEDGATLRVDAGDELSFDVIADDPDAGDIVTIDDLGRPAGMTCSESIPAQRSLKRCTWTPDASQAGSHILVFTATDTFGLSSVRSFEIEVEDAAFEINLTTFIPSNHVRTPFGCLRRADDRPGLERLRLVVRTDDRDFDATADTYRTRQLVTIEPREELDPDGLVGEPEHLVQPTRAYADDALADGRIDDADDDGIADDCRLFDRTATASNTRIDVDVTRIGPGQVAVQLRGGPGQALFGPPVGAEIDWHLSLLVDTRQSPTRWTLTGMHDGFPAYELYLKGERIYEFWPGDPPYGLFDLARLLPPMEIRQILVAGELDDG